MTSFLVELSLQVSLLPGLHHRNDQ